MTHSRPMPPKPIWLLAIAGAGVIAVLVALGDDTPGRPEHSEESRVTTPAEKPVPPSIASAPAAATRQSNSDAPTTENANPVPSEEAAPRANDRGTLTIEVTKNRAPLAHTVVALFGQATGLGSLDAPASAELETDERGTCVFEALPPGTYRAEVALGADVVCREAVDIPADGGGETLRLDLVTTRLDLLCVDENTQLPVSGAMLSLFSVDEDMTMTRGWNNVAARTTTGDSGRWSVEVPQGDYLVQVHVQGYVPRLLDLTTDRAAMSERIALEPEGERCYVKGRLIMSDETRRLVSDAFGEHIGVGFWPADVGDDPPEFALGIGGVLSTNDESFHVMGLPPGEYFFSTYPGIAAANRRRVLVAPPGLDGLEIHVAPGLRRVTLCTDIPELTALARNGWDLDLMLESLASPGVPLTARSLEEDGEETYVSLLRPGEYRYWFLSRSPDLGSCHEGVLAVGTDARQALIVGEDGASPVGECP